MCGGKRHGETGFFVEPTVLDGTSDKMRVYQEEIFGPVVTVMPFGGYKQSGWGREMGSEVLKNYLETKAICMSI